MMPLVTAPEYEMTGDSATHSPPDTLQTLLDVVSDVSDVSKKTLVQPGSLFLGASLYDVHAHYWPFETAYVSDFSGETAVEI